MGLLLIQLNPPLPPRRGIWAAHVHPQSVLWSSGRSFFRSFFRFDFELNFGLVLDSFWGRLGLLLAPFWDPKSGHVGPKVCREAVLFRKHQCSRNIGKRKARATFLTPRWAQDRLKTGPRRVQERSKSHAFFVLNFESFWNRLGLVWGVALGSKIDQKS